MVVVVLIASGAAVCLRLYKQAEKAGTADRILFTIRQGAGVMAALCATVFAVITALTTGKTVSMPGATGIPVFGTNRGGQPAAAA